MKNIFNSVFGSKSEVVINGVTYSGSNITMDVSGNITVDGNAVNSVSDKIVTVYINSSSESVSTTNGDVIFTGDVGDVSTTNGDVTINGSVDDVSTTNGNVYAKSITAKVKTVNGDIKVK